MGVRLVLVSRSPYFGIFGVLIQAITFALLLCIFGLPFFGLLTVLIYVGGMLIVFLFSTVLGAERYPDSGWYEIPLFSIILWVVRLSLVDSWDITKDLDVTFLRLSLEGKLGSIFSRLGFITLLVGVVLLVALMVVLNFGLEHAQATLRKL